MKTCTNCLNTFQPSSNHLLCPKCRGKAYKDKKCEVCGKTIQRKSQSCLICLNKSRGPWQTPESIAIKVTLNKARGHARNREFNITLPHLEELLKTQQGKCAYTGLAMELPKWSGCKDKRLCASLDRIDSTLGYTIGNVHWVIAPINYMKNNLRHQEFQELLEWIKQ